MSFYALIKGLHICCALLSISGFALRSYWLWREHPALQQRLTKTLPHIIDSVLLGTAALMVWSVWSAGPLQWPWLQAKLVALLLYIGLGMIAMRFGRTRAVRVSACAMALMTAFYILTVALTHSPQGFL